MKSPIPLLLLAPIPPVLWCLLSLMSDRALEQATIWITVVLAIFGWCGALILTFDTRKVVSNRVVVDIHPNRISASDGYQLEGAFSEGDRLVANADVLERMLVSVCERNLPSKGKLFYAKESALIRVWLGSCHFSPAEIRDLEKLAGEIFLEPCIEVVDSAGACRTSMQA